MDQEDQGDQKKRWMDDTKKIRKPIDQNSEEQGRKSIIGGSTSAGVKSDKTLSKFKKITN